MEMYVQLGRLCAADTIINNMDRIPLPIWDNSGNLGNIMVSAQGDVTAIDTQINLIVDEFGKEGYFRRVRDLISDCESGSASKTAAHLQARLWWNPPPAVLDTMLRALRR